MDHGTIIRTGITCKKIPLEKSIEFGIALKKGQKEGKNKFVTKSVGIIVYNYFHVKISLILLVKHLLYSVSSPIT